MIAQFTAELPAGGENDKVLINIWLEGTAQLQFRNRETQRWGDPIDMELQEV